MLERPFYLIFAVWGERYRNYLLRYCLPSLLAPGNVPALTTKRRSKLLLATLPEDWAVMRETAVIKAAEQFLDIVYLEMPPCPPDKVPVDHMGKGHLLACNMAFADQAYGCFLSPDLMLSDGTLARVQSLVEAGAEMVQVTALRLGEEPLFQRLRAARLVPEEDHAATGRPIAISGRDFVNVAMWSFHSETLSYEWSSPCFCQPFNILMPSAAWWRVPGEDGVIIHSLSFASLAFDYAAVRRHDTTALETAQLDADYVYRNLGHSTAIAVIRDSDEAFLASWTPLAVKPHPLVPNPSYPSRFLADVAKGRRFRHVFQGGFFDPLKQRLFFETVRWHAQPVTAQWPGVERRALRAIGRWVDPPDEGGRLSGHAARAIAALCYAIVSGLFRARAAIGCAWAMRDPERMRRYGALLGRLIRGDRALRQRVLARLGLAGTRIDRS